MMDAGTTMIRGLSALSEAGISNVERSDADARLVARIRAGDDDAFETLVGQYQAPLFRYLRGFVGDAELARDLVQETFLRAYKSLGSLEDPGLLRSWLYRIAHNQACSVLRRRRLISWLPLLPAHRSGGPAPDRSAIEAARVEEALGRVPRDQRAPLLLHLVGGFSYAEIARLLNVTEGTVRMRISRGRAAFRVAYGAGEDDDAP
jgi:RNA polymerase sigma-70 factor (ECF subfamily)